MARQTAQAMHAQQLPFRMRPGLQRLPAGEYALHPLQAGSALWQAKKNVVDIDQAVFCTAGFDPSDAIHSIANYAIGTRIFPAFDSRIPLALRVAEDLAVVDANGCVPWLCVCLPSHWAPEEKLGLSLAAIHAPVADNAALQSAMPALASLVCSGQSWTRWVWTISPSAHYDQHPKRHPRRPWPAPDDAQAYATACWLRTERQCFVPVYKANGDLAHQAIFSIGLAMQPLTEAVQNPGMAAYLHDALATMSDAVLAYKNLDRAKAPLLRYLRLWLDGHSVGATEC